MAHGVLKEFDLEKESIKDFRERFEFYCVTNKIKNDGDDLRSKKALFLMLLGHKTFSKLKVLSSPTPVSNLTMEAIMTLLLAHYRPQTIEIAEHFKGCRNPLRAKGTGKMVQFWQTLEKYMNFQYSVFHSGYMTCRVDCIMFNSGNLICSVAVLT